MYITGVCFFFGLRMMTMTFFPRFFATCQNLQTDTHAENNIYYVPRYTRDMRQPLQYIFVYNCFVRRRTRWKRGRSACIYVNCMNNEKKLERPTWYIQVQVKHSNILLYMYLHIYRAAVVCRRRHYRPTDRAVSLDKFKKTVLFFFNKNNRISNNNTGINIYIHINRGRCCPRHEHVVVVDVEENAVTREDKMHAAVGPTQKKIKIKKGKN